MKILSVKTLKILHLTAIILFVVLLIAVYIVSAVWGGIAHTGGGLPVPDTALTIPSVIFLLLSVVQVIFAVCNKPKSGIVLTVAKCALFLLAIIILCRFALNAGYIQYNADAGFYSNATFSVCVIASIAIGALSFIAELSAAVLSLQRREVSRDPS